MGADENVAIMQRAFDAFNACDIDTLTELFDENVIWHMPGRSSKAKDYEGRDATLGYFGQIGQEMIRRARRSTIGSISSVKPKVRAAAAQVG